MLQDSIVIQNSNSYFSFNKGIITGAYIMLSRRLEALIILKNK